MRGVIFEEAGLALGNQRVERRRAADSRRSRSRRSACCFVAGLIGLFVSDRANRRFVEESRQQIAASCRSSPRAGSRAATIRSRCVPLLDAARDLPGGARRISARTARRGGRSSASISARSWAASRGGCTGFCSSQALLPMVVERMEDELRRGLTASDAAREYEVLRAYLMLGEPAHFDASALVGWTMRDWLRGPLQSASRHPARRAGELQHPRRAVRGPAHSVRTCRSTRA